MIGKLIGLVAVAYVGTVLFGQKKMSDAEEIWNAAETSGNEDAVSIDVLARTLWGEARGEGEGGMYAVACVIQNRVRAPGWWGATWREVSQKPWQFSCWNAADPNRIKLLAVDTSDEQFAQAVEIATRAVNGGLEDVTGGATNYKATWAIAAWADKMTKVAVIGGHEFYV